MFVCVDYTNEYQFYFTNPQTWILWAVVDLHDYLMYFLINVFVIVIVFTIVCLFFQQTWFKLGGLKIKWWKSKSYEKENYLKRSRFVVFLYNKFKLYSFNHAPLLEFFWTITPTLMLIAMGWPSFRVLYAMEQLIDPIHTIIIIGNQWYWTYNYSDFDVVSDLVQQLDSNNLTDMYIEEILLMHELVIGKEHVKKKKLLQAMSKYLRKFEESKIMYDCVIISDENLPKGYPRLLSTDQVLILPTYVSIRLLVTSVDVIHSWALPSHGIKMDAIPGRVNQINFLAQTSGTYWGQCSELCGINHGFMPIEVRVLPLDDYLSYISLNISYRQDKLLLIVEKFFEAFMLRENKKFVEKVILGSIDSNINDYDLIFEDSVSNDLDTVISSPIVDTLLESFKWIEDEKNLNDLFGVKEFILSKNIVEQCLLEANKKRFSRNINIFCRANTDLQLLEIFKFNPNRFIAGKRASLYDLIQPSYFKIKSVSDDVSEKQSNEV